MAKKQRRTAGSSKTKRRSRKTKKPANIQAKVRDLTLKAIAERNLTLDQLSGLAGEMLHSATRVMKDALPSSRKSALRQLLKGMEDAWAATASASVSTLRHARRYGLPLAKRDVKNLSKRLGSLEKDFIKTIDSHARRIGGDLGSELKSVTGRIRKAGSQIRPAAQAAQRAITARGATLAREVVSAGSKAGEQALRGVLATAGGVLEGAGKAARLAARKRRTKSK